MKANASEYRRQWRKVHLGISLAIIMSTLLKERLADDAIAHIANIFSKINPSFASNFDRQVTELQVRVAILNRFTHLGTPSTQRVF